MDYRRSDLKRLFHVLVVGSAFVASSCDHGTPPVDSSDPVDSGSAVADAGHPAHDAGNATGTDAAAAVDLGASDVDAGGICGWPCSC